MGVVRGWLAAHPTEVLGVSLALKRERLWNGQGRTGEASSTPQRASLEALFAVATAGTPLAEHDRAFTTAWCDSVDCHT